MGRSIKVNVLADGNISFKVDYTLVPLIHPLPFAVPKSIFVLKFYPIILNNNI